MSEQVIICPQCKLQIPLTEAISHQFRESARKEWETELQEQLSKRLALERDKISLQLKDLQKQNQEKSQLLADTQARELKLLSAQREVEERAKTMDLEVARKVEETRKAVADEVARRAAQEHRMKDLEKEKKISDLLLQIEEMKRRAEQGSQQTQGEVVELELENLLRMKFPSDSIEPVAKGVRGADIIQRVTTKSGQLCGAIIWELKNTKNWSDGWVEKLKDDQRAVKAELAVLLTTVLPKEISSSGLYQGVWVTNHASMTGLAAALRMSLIQVAHARAAAEGKNETMEAVYNYIHGTQFKQRIEALAENFRAMQEQLDQEKRAMTKIWAQREKQIERVEDSMIGMHGDLKGIIGGSLPSIKSLELDTPILNLPL